ncbi:MAG: UDP-N-acetylmuramoyl-tripeptide--D-alanyl-D-alanine ligase [Cetobacterium sp.]
MKTFNQVLVDCLKNIDITLPKDIFIENIQMDSKNVDKNSLFIAINNGNNYISEVLKKEVKLVIADRDVPELENKNVIKVENSVKFLQNLAKMYREKLGIKVIGITGSEGKTTTKDLVAGVLSQKFKVIKTLGNHNNHIGLPFTILQIKDNHEIAVLEMGMSNLGEIDLLSKIAKPNYGVITNIGDSHLEFLKNRDNVFIAKTELLKYVTPDNTLLFGDDPYFKSVNGIKIGFNEENDYILSNLKEEYEGVYFNLNNEEYFISLNGAYNTINASFAIVLGRMLEMSYNEIKNALENVKITSMRFEKIEKNGILYINDAYNASPVSMKMALKAYSSLPFNRNKVVVLADALELGEKEIEYHIEVLEEVLKYDFYKIFVYGERMKKAINILKDSRIIHFNQKNDIKLKLSKLDNIGVLLKGSRGMKLEEIIM